MNGQPSLRRYLDLQAQLAEHDQAIGHLELQKAQHSTPPWDIESELLRRRAQKKQIMQELDDLAAAAIEPPPATRKPATRNPPGRPTKLNEEMIRAIAHAARSGLWKKDLCALVGIHPASLNAWLEIGEAEAERMAQGEPLNPDNALQFKLYLATRQAEAESKRARLERLNTAGDNGDWRADTWFLEHRFPEEFGKRVELGLTPRPMQPFTADEAAAADRELTSWRETLTDAGN